ncbi:protein DpdF [Nocardia wallacei]|uniref:protein DpdF n=1 Tax=Nocardia wallacei TaxID=480035 RepID=UPI002455866B|nr:protein DpdF [Nocardia wallacei]
MNFDSWTGAQRLFSQWPTVPSSDNVTGLQRRLTDAVRALGTHSASKVDVAVLTRQVLLDAAARGNNVGLVVPLDPALPGISEWSDIDCMAVAISSGLRVWALPWTPETAESPLARAAAAEDLVNVHLGREAHQRFTPMAVPADPFMTSAFGHRSYKSVGQRQLARTVALAEAGTTLVLSLPTGQGKTAVALAAGLVSPEQAGLTVVVVPTVVLALDMERRTREVMRHHDIGGPHDRFAYLGGLGDEDKRWMWDAIKSGRQRILFTSPEALVTGLARALAEAATAGHFRYFVIDEAHLVEQWGIRFRQSFQTMARHRNQWVSSAPEGRAPVTVAMSATFTQDQISSLTLMFGDPARTRVVSAAQLRHEPSFYATHHKTVDARVSAVLRAVHLLPKPMVLYVSTRSDARWWRDRLHQAGLHRVTTVTGESSDAERQDAMTGWSGRDSTGEVTTVYDVVVGTSAFGLGVDVGDVRTIVHACVPESLDRFYQEVGRGGRDGLPSLSVLMSTDNDFEVAASLADERLISAALAFERWRAMFVEAERLQTQVYRIDLDRYRSDLSGTSKSNRGWNLHLLGLMHRARLIDLSLSAPPEAGADVWDDELGTPGQPAERFVQITLLDSAANREEEFSQRIRHVRGEIKRSRRRAVDGIRDMLSGRQCMGEVLADYYSTDDIAIGVTCRGCPRCRQADTSAGKDFYRLAAEPAPFLPAPVRGDHDPLVRFRGAANCLSIAWDGDAEFQRTVPRLLTALVRRGLTVVGGPGATTELMATLQRDVGAVPVIHDRDDDLLKAYAGPMLWVGVPDTRCLPTDLIGRIRSTDVVYALHPATTVHPEKVSEAFATIHRPTVSVRTVLEFL